jgi:putative restriction endonuclease
VTPLQRSRLEKAAADCGFELTPELQGAGLVLRSAQFPESVIVELLSDSSFVLRADTTAVLIEPGGVVGPSQVDGYDALYDALERAAATARTLPNRIAEKFLKVTAALPRSTEAERLVVQRVGQQLFRAALLDYWRGCCPVTGLAIPGLLRASHIKPWAACGDDDERLDVYNGLLLAPQLDALFDGGWATFEPTGELRLAAGLGHEAEAALGLAGPLRPIELSDRHRKYLDFHQVHVFRDHWDAQ